jgi:transglutaminase-like putative cysteine protease
LHAFHPEQQRVSHGQQQHNYPIYYAIRHMTRFRYTIPISESVMEVRMRPRSEGIQRCLEFSLQTEPRSFPQTYRDYMGNTIHHFNIPGRHTQLTITAETLIEMDRARDIPEAQTSAAWDELDALCERGDYTDFLLPSTFAHPSELLSDLMRDLNMQRCDDPLTTLRMINSAIYETFDYVPHSTRVDSPIDDALRVRRGVCQDFAHLMIALGRELGIPCRYVSGYLFHRAEDHDRSEEDATHAWLEAFLPDLGWVGFDPTNNLLAGDRHIRTAIGRDYDDVPPTRGVFKGNAGSELDVGVRVAPAEAPVQIVDDTELLPAIHWQPPDPEQDEQQAQQQQQQ